LGRKLNREELLTTNPLLSMLEGGLLEGQLPQTLVWHSYEEYVNKNLDPPFRISFDEIYSGNTEERTYTYHKEDMLGDPYLEVPEDARVHREYKPLVDEPDLFLRFARLPLPSTDITTDRAVTQTFHGFHSDWLFKYGLLGLQQGTPVPLSLWDSEFGPMAPRHSDKGGSEDSLGAFAAEVMHANWLLVLYEAALSKDAETLEEAIFSHPYVTLFYSDISDGFWELSKTKAQVVGGTRADLLADAALTLVTFQVGLYLDACAYPRPTVEVTARKLVGPDSLNTSLEPRNLLGAMYLQFYWLITSARELSRCKYCNRLISHGPPTPGSGRKRKIYSNKQFCSDGCRQEYHYHNRTKPKRNAEKNGGNG
jgi:hypothetical protein